MQFTLLAVKMMTMVYLIGAVRAIQTRQSVHKDTTFAFVGGAESRPNEALMSTSVPCVFQ